MRLTVVLCVLASSGCCRVTPTSIDLCSAAAKIEPGSPFELGYELLDPPCGGEPTQSECEVSVDPVEKSIALKVLVTACDQAGSCTSAVPPSHIDVCRFPALAAGEWKLGLYGQPAKLLRVSQGGSRCENLSAAP